MATKITTMAIVAFREFSASIIYNLFESAEAALASAP